MALPKSFHVVGCDSELAAEIDKEFSDFFPGSCINDTVSRPNNTNVTVSYDDDDFDIESDSDDERVDVVKSPLIQSRIRSFLNQSNVCDSNNSSDDDNDDQLHVDVDENEWDRTDKNALRSVREKCTRGCLDAFKDEEIIDNRLNMQAMDKDSRDMLVIGQLQACGVSKGSETRTGVRKRHRFDYQYNNSSICKSCYLFVNNINVHYLKNLREHFLKNGAVPRAHGNTRRTPKHAVTYQNAQQIIQFLSRYADEVGIPQAAAPRGRDGHPPVYLPGRETYKSVHQKYESICRETNSRCLSETTFRRLWQRCLPHIQFMIHRTDVCHICEMYRNRIQKAVTEAEKLRASQEFSDHILDAQKERDHYRARCQAAITGLEGHPKSDIPLPAASQELSDVHYTFDFAQSIMLPYHCRQEGVLYFRSLYKANMFGVCNDGRSLQSNYIFGEEQSIGIDGQQSHSANSVVSMLHHFFANHGEGEKICYLNADNCGGQNKNQVVTSYFAWRVANGLHQDIYLHFMKPYHARCLVDGMFGIARRRIRRSDCDSLLDLQQCVEQSSPHNQADLYSELSANSWKWRDWKGHFKPVFRAVPGIQQYHHFHFSSRSPGIVKVKKTVDGEETEVRLLKRGKVIPETLPSQLGPGGLSPTRAWYLYHSLRPFVRDPNKDLLCPLPSVPEMEQTTSAAVSEE